MSLFKKKTDGEPESRPEAGAGKNKVSLLILLVILAVFAYLYFFTSLIVPHEAPAPAKPAAPVTVKQSLPPRPDATGATTAPAPAAGQNPAATTPPPAAAPPAPAAPPAAAPKQAAAPAVAPKPAAAPPVKKEEAKPAKPAEQKPAPAAVPAPKKDAPQPVKAEKPAPAMAKQPAPAPAAAKAEQKPAKPEGKAKGEKSAGTVPEKAAAPTYTVLVGEFSAAGAPAVEAKLKKHKIKPVRHGVLKNRQMTRLYYGSYTNYDSYAVELEKLKQAAKGAFAVEKNGTYTLYAGSFGSPAHAATERKRLADKGLKVEPQQVSLPVGMVKLSAGPFTKAAATKAAASLKGEGLTVKVIPKGK